MRRVKIVDRPDKFYSYAAVDLETGEIPLRLRDQAELVAICHRLGRAADQVSAANLPQHTREAWRPVE